MARVFSLVFRKVLYLKILIYHEIIKMTENISMRGFKQEIALIKSSNLLYIVTIFKICCKQIKKLSFDIQTCHLLRQFHINLILSFFMI